ncbi:MAG TPA: antibiotic biosynthesis monooxygenase family protein [Streptosporangiaceae bacterium]|nr:antibiotic biosynthesis monooxygenase family protein [Streptosporangiaceae bacterium]
MSAEDGQDASAGYRVLFMLKLSPGAGEAFLREYEAVRWQVAQVPGHMSDQVCRSADDADEWLITSEWRSAEDFLAWESTPGHREAATPMMSHVRARQSLRYTVLRETRTAPAAAGDAR